jgi:DNA modification methylase
MKLTDNEKRDAVRFIEEGKPLPEKYRFLLFDESKQVELTWNGKSDEVTNVVLPFQSIEHVDEPRSEDKVFAQNSFDFVSGRQTAGWTNKLIWGDNKYILSSLKNGPMRDEIEKNGGIKLIYIDPPFDVQADFSMNVEIGDSTYEKKPNVLEHIAYRDTWGKGSDSFLSMIYERLFLMKDLLADDGNLYVHCDWRLSAQIKLILNEIFDSKFYRNEIIWHYSTLGRPDDRFAQKHDTIYCFGKTERTFFNALGAKVPYSDDYLKSHFKDKDEEGRQCRKRFDAGKWRTYYPDDGMIPNDVWEIPYENSMSKTRTGYPTQKPEKLLERIIKSSSNENDIVCDFFVGSGTTAAVAEKLNRKWICTDLGKFGIHTTRKRLINVQRELKKNGKDYRAFEILNLGKYQRQHFIYDGKNERDELKQQEKIKRENDFKTLILGAYKATEVQGFNTLHGKKGYEFVSIGPVNQALSRNHVEEVINECIKNNITSVDILAFEFEMGWDRTLQEEAKDKGIRLSYKQIPIDVFDKRAVQKGEVIFYDIAYIEFKPTIKKNLLSIELTDFAVFYNEGNLNINEELQAGKSKIVVENGDLVEKRKDKEGNVTENILTKNWHDWIDYWSVDFDYESKPEVIKFKKDDGSIEEVWTGNYVFENEWQSFRTKDDKKLELVSSEKEVLSGKTKVAVKVVDIFGNDTIKVLEVKI